MTLYLHRPSGELGSVNPNSPPFVVLVNVDGGIVWLLPSRSVKVMLSLGLACWIVALIADGRFVTFIVKLSPGTKYWSGTVPKAVLTSDDKMVG